MCTGYHGKQQDDDKLLWKLTFVEVEREPKEQCIVDQLQTGIGERVLEERGREGREGRREGGGKGGREEEREGGMEGVMEGGGREGGKGEKGGREGERERKRQNEREVTKYGKVCGGIGRRSEEQKGERRERLGEAGCQRNRQHSP